MEAPRLERKLVAILAADVEGYSRHMERDEAATLATLSAHRLIVDDLVDSHNGRITGTAGDSVLAEFASVVEAVDCAVKIQDALAAANEALPERAPPAVPHRHQCRRRHGQGRRHLRRRRQHRRPPEMLAEPGGICISRGVRDHVRKMGRFAFEDLGEQSVKNIDQPIRAFRLRGVDATAAPAPSAGDGASAACRATAPPTAPLRQQASPAEEAEFELTFWELIKDSGEPPSSPPTSNAIPAGAFAALAESRRQALLEEAAAPAAEAAAADQAVSAVELAYWDTVKDSANPEMYSAYLERYPEGAFAAVGESSSRGTRIAALRPEPQCACSPGCAARRSPGSRRDHHAARSSCDPGRRCPAGPCRRRRLAGRRSRSWRSISAATCSSRRRSRCCSPSSSTRSSTWVRRCCRLPLAVGLA